MSAAEVQELKDYIDIRLTGPVGSDVKDIREQLCGQGSRDAGQYDGWPQLGGRTTVDALALILNNQKAIAERLDRLEGGAR